MRGAGAGDAAMRSLVVLLAVPALLLPGASLGYIVWQAAPALSWTFVTSGEEGGFGATGGVLPQLAGSLSLAAGAAVIAAPLALGAALYDRLFATAAQRRALDTLLHIVQGIPPLVFGLAGLVVLVHMLDWGVSLASGAVVLAGVILPLMALNAVAALERVAPVHTEAARSLGLSDTALVLRVWLPQAWPAVVTGILLGIARALSETAPVLFTAAVFSGIKWPDSIFSPVTTLQTHIFYLAQEGNDPAAVTAAWASAAVLVGAVACFGLLARLARRAGGMP